jgi:hypothetical protein
MRFARCLGHCRRIPSANSSAEFAEFRHRIPSPNPVVDSGADKLPAR